MWPMIAMEEHSRTRLLHEEGDSCKPWGLVQRVWGLCVHRTFLAEGRQELPGQLWFHGLIQFSCALGLFFFSSLPSPRIWNWSF